MAFVLVACTPGKPTPPPAVAVVPISAIANETSKNLTVFDPMECFSPLVVTGGKTPYVFSHTDVLPAGITHSEGTGLVCGTPTEISGAVTLVFSVRDAEGNVASTTSTVVFTVHPAPTFSVSGKITGGTQVGVVLTASPSGKTTTSGPSGAYSLTGLVSGVYTVTPSLAGTTFTPASRQVTVNGGSVTGVNFDTPVQTLKTGKLVYPCTMAMCVKDLSTDAETVLWGGFNLWPEKLALTRTGRKIAFNGSNLGGIHILSLDTLTISSAVSANEVPPHFGYLTQIAGVNECTAWAEEFDVSENGDFVATSNRCFLLGFPEKRDIFLVKTDGTLSNVRVTNDTAFDTSPVVCSPGGVASAEVSVCFVRNGTEIWKQVVSPVDGLLIGGPTLIASNVMAGAIRPMSVNRTYTQIVYAKNVGGASHIVVIPLAGGAEVDLGGGTNPHWSLDGSELILFETAQFPLTMWAIKPDGTGRVSVPTPSNVTHTSPGQVVFLQ